MSEIASDCERLQIWDCISSKRGYEGNAAFQFGKDKDHEWDGGHEFWLLKDFIGSLYLFSGMAARSQWPNGHALKC